MILNGPTGLFVSYTFDFVIIIIFHKADMF